jgi:hypothetical protein
MYVNNNDSNGSAMIGDTAEKLFVSLAQQKGYTVIDATLYENIHLHWDYKLTTKSDKSLRFDVKGKKRLNRHDTEFNDIIFVEFKNNAGNIGWLYGEADYIAFLLSGGFYLVNRKLLVDKVHQLIDVGGTVYESTRNKQNYVLYNRGQYGKSDVFALITKHDLLSIKHYKWEV